jgi:alcohol dehydrogenase class IV
LARNTDSLGRLAETLEKVKVSIVGKRIGMKPHTLWSEVLEITADARACEADLILTLGGGSLTDGAKVVAFVRHLAFPANSRARRELTEYDRPSRTTPKHSKTSKRFAWARTRSHPPH